MKLKFITLLLLLASNPVLSKNFEKEWIDFNYALCEGAGIHASGRVKAKVEAISEGGYYRVTSFEITMTHPLKKHYSASVKYIDNSSEKKKVLLVKPWFPIITEKNHSHLLLPQNRNSANPGPDEQMDIYVSKKHPVEIDVNILVSHETGTGTCPVSFSTSWKMD